MLILSHDLLWLLYIRHISPTSRGAAGTQKVQPLSVDPPQPIDFQRTKVLDSFLRSFNLIEPREERENREMVIGLLNDMIDRLVKEFCRMKKMPEEQVAKTNMKVCRYPLRLRRRYIP